MIRRLFSPRPSSSANSSRARLRRAKQARWRQQRRLSLETLATRYLLTEIPSLSDAQATYQATMTTLWSQAEMAAQTRDTALAAAESQRQTSIGPEQANFDADEER